MSKRTCFIVCLVLLLSAPPLRSQARFKTPEQFLTEAGVALDRASLMQALDDNRTGVMASAATVLAQRGVTDAVPAIDSRMKTEQNKQLVLTLAQSLNLLGSQDGTKRLEAFCLGNEVDRAERMRAAYALANTKNYACLPAMPEFLNSTQASDKQAALLYLLQVPSSQGNSPKSLDSALLVIASNDPDQEFRTQAKKIIAQIGDPATKEALRKSQQE